MLGFNRTEKLTLTVVIGKHWSVDAICDHWATKGSTIGCHMDVESNTVSYTVTIPKKKKGKFIWDVERLIASGVLIEIKET